LLHQGSWIAGPAEQYCHVVQGIQGFRQAVMQTINMKEQISTTIREIITLNKS